MKSFKVICHTKGCENENISIDIFTPDNEPIVVCGPCGVQITDIV